MNPKQLVISLCPCGNLLISGRYYAAMAFILTPLLQIGCSFRPDRTSSWRVELRISCLVPKRLNRLVSRYGLILLAMATLFCEVFVPYHRDGVLFAGPRDAVSVGKFISSFSSFDFWLFDFNFFFLSCYCLSVYSLVLVFGFIWESWVRHLGVCGSTP